MLFLKPIIFTMDFKEWSAKIFFILLLTLTLRNTI